MSGTRMVFTGLAELKAALRNLPAELAGEASHLIEGAANAAAADIKAQYHVRTTNLNSTSLKAPGGLRDGVVVTHFDKGKFHPGAIVKSTAPHAWLYDNGSQARHYITAGGTPHETGAMWGRTAPTHVFVRALIKNRHRMYQQLKDLLVRKGLVVTGDV